MSDPVKMICTEKLYYLNCELRTNISIFNHGVWLPCAEIISILAIMTLANNALLDINKHGTHVFQCVFFLRTSDDNFMPALFYTVFLPLHWCWEHSQTNTAVYCETHCSVVTNLLVFGFGRHLDLKKKLPVGTICQSPATLS